MKKILLLFLSAPLWGVTFGQGKTVTVYTTADKPELHFSPNGKLSFSDYPQPPETEPFILVDASKAFQSYIGIGGGLTDAAAETFAKIPKAQQQELLTAYYDPIKGIGYTVVVAMNTTDATLPCHLCIKTRQPSRRACLILSVL